jgi:hypothetical protein
MLRVFSDDCDASAAWRNCRRQSVTSKTAETASSNFRGMHCNLG